MLENGTYELYSLNRTDGEVIKGHAISVAFVARNRFAGLEKQTRNLVVRDFKNEVVKRIVLPSSSTDRVFQANTSGRVLLRSPDRVALFELQSRRVIAEVHAHGVRYVFWSPDGAYAAMLSKHGLVIADRSLKQLCSIHENVRVKSGAWDPHGVFIYTTLNHVKYVLPTEAGDTGVVRTLSVPVYVVAASATELQCLDRDAKLRTLAIDNTEYVFKMALLRRQYDQVLAIIRGGKLCGQAVIAYLQASGYPEVALHFVKDEATRFDLALECGNLEVALASAHALNSDSCWSRLATEALRQGNHQVVEMAYQQVKNFERLSFLYMITGNTDKLRKMLRIAELRGDAQSRFHNALYLGAVEERVSVLEGAGQIPLAYAAAATHGLTEKAEALRKILEVHVCVLGVCMCVCVYVCVFVRACARVSAHAPGPSLTRHRAPPGCEAGCPRDQRHRRAHDAADANHARGQLAAARGREGVLRGRWRGGAAYARGRGCDGRGGGWRRGRVGRGLRAAWHRARARGGGGGGGGRRRG